MIGMQYKVQLPADYDMKIIRNRIEQSGSKTDGFKDLVFKGYFISEKDEAGGGNCYRPFYIWNNTEGMNNFLFDGHFDNILASFGWQNVEIGILKLCERKVRFSYSQYAVEEIFDIQEQAALKEFSFKEDMDRQAVGKVIIYNPDKWKYSTFTFYEQLPKEAKGKLLKLMYLSKGAAY